MTDNIRDLSCIPLCEIEAAASVLRHHDVYATPLIPLNYDVPDKNIYLKLENLQPVGSFKIRAAVNAISQLPSSVSSKGVYTCSAGNFGQGLAWAARKLGVPCTVVCPDNAPTVKLDAIRRYGADIITVSYDTWWSAMEERRYDGVAGTFLHPVCEREVLAGNGTMGLEIAKDLAEVDTVICPWGGGGIATGTASALRMLKPKAKVIACEVITGAPLTASFAAGHPTEASNFRKSFVDGMNGKTVLEPMWKLARSLIADTVVLSLAEVCDAIRLLAERNHVIAEGAGAATVAAALSSRVPPGNIVCVISGGNIETNLLADILRGHDPE